jgi:fumarate reductase subunit C
VSSLLFLAQRLSAIVLAAVVVVHLATILYAVNGGLTAGEILARTRGSAGFLAFYAVFVIAAAVHAPIGLRTVGREWLGWRSGVFDLVLLGVAVLLVILGLRAAFGLYMA